MNRLLAGLFLVALALSACSSGTPTRTVNGELSAHTKAEAVKAAKGAAASSQLQTAATRRTTRTTRRTRPTTVTVPQQPTTPTTPTTISQSGVAGVVLYETDCAADRPCSLAPGPAKLALQDKRGRVVTTANTNEHGAFIIQAAPGNYVLVATPPAKKQRCAPVPITVTAGQYATTRVQCGAK